MRSYNSLRREGVHTVGSLTALSEQDLLAMDGLGPASVKDIQERLADRGLSLGTVAAANGAAGAAPASTAAASTAPAAGPGPMVADRDLAASNGLLPPQSARPPDEDALDLLSVAGLPVLKRVLPAIGVALFGAILFGLLRRRRRRARG